MPKAASSTVITYRIELQDTERRLLSNFIDAYTLEQVSTPIVEILKDASALYAIVTLVELFTDIDLLIPTLGDVGDVAAIWDAVGDAVRQARANAAAAGAIGIQLSPFGTILRGIEILREGTGSFEPETFGGVTAAERAAGRPVSQDDPLHRGY